MAPSMAVSAPYTFIIGLLCAVLYQEIKRETPSFLPDQGIEVTGACRALLSRALSYRGTGGAESGGSFPDLQRLGPSGA